MLVGYQRKEPVSIEAGTTVLFEKCLPEYPANQGWFCQYSIIGLGAQVTFQSVADGDDHAVTIAASVTALWLATPTAKMAGYVCNNTLVPPQTFRIYFESCPILPNLLTPPADQPSKTFFEQLVEKLQKLYLEEADSNLLVAHVGDSSFKFESKKELYEALCMARVEVRVERDKERARNGRPSRRRFTPVVSITPPGPLWGQQYPSGWIGN